MPADPPEPVYLTALVQRVRKAAEASGLADWEFRVDWKRNPAGDVVVAVIVKASAKGWPST